MESAPVTEPVVQAPKPAPAEPPVARPAPERTRTPARAPLEAALRAEATSFEFFAAVRHLERMRPASTPLGRTMDAAGEPVRFSARASLAFPPSELHSLDMDGDGPARMSVNFMGLIGPVGVLPHHYTTRVIERNAARDTAMRDFFDIFHHRLISLFYRAWEKHRFALTYEKDEDRLRGHLLDLVGLGLERQQAALPVPADTLVYYAALLVGRSRSAAALERLLADFFDAPVEVEQFVGDWYAVARGDQCELGQEEDVASSQLGLGSIVGDEIWDQQCKARVRIGPLPRERYEQFLPGGSAHDLLRDLVRFFSDDQYGFEVQLVLARDDVPALELGAPEAEQPLGWTTWLRSRPFAHDPDDTILAL